MFFKKGFFPLLKRVGKVPHQFVKGKDPGHGGGFLSFYGTIQGIARGIF
jgi:hypothetical protein